MEWKKRKDKGPASLSVVVVVVVVRTAGQGTASTNDKRGVAGRAGIPGPGAALPAGTASR